MRRMGKSKTLIIKTITASIALLFLLGTAKPERIYAVGLPQQDGNFEYTTGGELTKYWGNEEEVVIPSVLRDSEGETVITSIGAECFNGQSTLKSITIPDSINKIGARAFANTTALYEMTIPATVTQIGEESFYNSVIRRVNIETGSNAFEKDAFYGCKHLESVTFSPHALWQEIPSQMFYGARSLQGITLPEGVGKIGVSAFSGSGLKTVGLPSTLRTISYGAFSGSALESLQFPGNMRRIGDEAFAGTKLRSVSWPGTVSTIGDSVFSGCSSLSEIMIPGSVTSIGEWAFDTGGSVTVYNASGEPVLGGTSLRDVNVQYLLGRTVLNTYAALTVDASLNGKITLGGAQAVKGQIIYCLGDISVMPVAGYTLESLELNGSKVNASHFLMPGTASVLAGSVHSIPVEIPSNPPQPEPIPPDSEQNPPQPEPIPPDSEQKPPQPELNPPDSSDSPGDTGNTAAPKKGSKVKDKGSKAVYKILSVSGIRKVEYISSTEKKPKTVKIPSQIKIKGKTYRVTSIAASAFYKSKELKSVSIPKNITSIGKSAFYGAKKLKTIEIKSTTLKTVGKQAFYGIDKKAQFKVPKKYYSKYQKLLKGKGIKSSMKWKKI